MSEQLRAPRPDEPADVARMRRQIEAEENAARMRRQIEAEENAALDVQYMVIDRMRALGLERRELADRAGLPAFKVENFFAPGSNPPVKLVARLLDALDARLVVRSEERDGDR